MVKLSYDRQVERNEKRKPGYVFWRVYDLGLQRVKFPHQSHINSLWRSMFGASGKVQVIGDPFAIASMSNLLVIRTPSGMDRRKRAHFFRILSTLCR